MKEITVKKWFNIEASERMNFLAKEREVVITLPKRYNMEFHLKYLDEPDGYCQFTLDFDASKAKGVKTLKRVFGEFNFEIRNRLMTGNWMIPCNL